MRNKNSVGLRRIAVRLQGTLAGAYPECSGECNATEGPKNKRGEVIIFRRDPKMLYNHVVDMLNASGFPFKVHAHQPICTIEEARAKVPHLTRNLLKTVVFKIKDADWILAAVNGSARIHYKKLADACV